MASQNDDPARRRRRPKPKSKSSMQDAQSIPGSSSLRDGRNDVRHAEERRDRPSTSTPGPRSKAKNSARSSRAASPSGPDAAPPPPVTIAPTGSSRRTKFAMGEDYIAFDFSDGEEQEDNTFLSYSPEKGKDKERMDVIGRDGENGLKRSASQMEGEDNGYTTKKQRLDAASRLTPWAEDVDWHSCRNLAEMMHNEVDAFVNYISPRFEEHEVRSMVVAMITRAIRASWPDAEVLPFGSFGTKLYLPLGDIDLVIQSRDMDRHNKRQILYNLAQVLRKTNITSNVTVIAKAKVPIVKFITNLGRLAVDISLNQSNGVVACRIVNRFLDEFPALRSLVLVIKLFLSQRSMNEVYTGGLGSYSIVCMAVSFLQMHPKIRSGEIDPSQNLGVLVMEFFELYGHYFNYDHTGISIRDGGTYFNKKHRGWVDDRQSSLLSIEDPNDISNDISKSSYNITRVRKTLAGAHEILTTAALLRARILTSKAQGHYTTLRPPGSSDQGYDNPSILGSVLGVTQETINHRRMIRQLYEQGTLQTLLGLAPYQSASAVRKPESVESSSRAASNHAHTDRSKKVVETAWKEADMEISESEGEIVERQSPEAEESRYAARHSRKRRRVETNGRHANLHGAVFVEESDEEQFVVPQVTHRTRTPHHEDTKGSTALNARETRDDRRRAYWASKGMRGDSLDYSD